MSTPVIGIDVSRDTLDAHVRPAGTRRSFDNTPAGIADLVVWARTFAPQRIILESTGPYQKAAVGALLAAGLPAVVVNARQARDFAKGFGYLAKTDRIDAAMLAHFGELVPTTVRPLDSRELLDLQQLLDRRSQLVGQVTDEKNRRHAAVVAQASAIILASIDDHLAYLKRQIKDLESRMDRLVEATEAFRAKDDILQTITGVGPHVARILIAWLPELGQRTRSAIAALAGLAPFHDDSGASQGARHIRGGRSKVRVSLYQAAVAAVRHCPRMKAHYAALKARGKASRVALVAVARKILVMANAMLRTMTPYNALANSVC
jgi:transposase